MGPGTQWVHIREHAPRNHGGDDDLGDGVRAHDVTWQLISGLDSPDCLGQDCRLLGSHLGFQDLLLDYLTSAPAGVVAAALAWELYRRLGPGR
jgi:hypothetical protein